MMKFRIKVCTAVAATLLIVAGGYEVFLAKRKLDTLNRVLDLQGEYLFDFEVGQTIDNVMSRRPDIALCWRHDVYAINLARTEVQTEDLQILRYTPNLTVLWLSNTNIGDDALIHILKLRQLEELAIENTRISRAGLADLQKEIPHTRVVTEPLSPF
jgi:hypothetical protein